MPLAARAAPHLLGFGGRRRSPGSYFEWAKSAEWRRTAAGGVGGSWGGGRGGGSGAGGRPRHTEIIPTPRHELRPCERDTEGGEAGPRQGVLWRAGGGGVCGSQLGEGVGRGPRASPGGTHGRLVLRARVRSLVPAPGPFFPLLVPCSRSAFFLFPKRACSLFPGSLLPPEEAVWRRFDG
eukprot:scaffold1983_cov107-Isochrysis_galbana.AAC.3